MKQFIKNWLGIKDSKWLDEEITTCETCKCLIRKEDAFIGDPEIRYRTYGSISDILSAMNTSSYRDNYIYTPYYCLKCKPKRP